jgi:hypothetical protein
MVPLRAQALASCKDFACLLHPTPHFRHTHKQRDRQTKKQSYRGTEQQSEQAREIIINPYMRTDTQEQTEIERPLQYLSILFLQSD